MLLVRMPRADASVPWFSCVMCGWLFSSPHDKRTFIATCVEGFQQRLRPSLTSDRLIAELRDAHCVTPPA